MKIAYSIFVLIVAAGILASSASALSANLVITGSDGMTFYFECQTDFEAETYDWDIGDGPDRLVLYDVLDSTAQYTFSEGELGRASCTAWDRETGEVAIHEIYFDVPGDEPSTDIEVFDVNFRGCSEAWIVFDDFSGPVNASVHTSIGHFDIEITESDLTKIPGQYGDMDLYKVKNSAFGSNVKLLYIMIDGETYTNTNRCAQNV
jgi:hypothetical protein